MAVRAALAGAMRISAGMARDQSRAHQHVEDIEDPVRCPRTKLTEHGVLERRAHSQHPPRFEYHLTGKGRALFPVITALLAWGDQWAPTPAGPPVVLVHDACGNITTPVLRCPHCDGEVSAANTHSEPSSRL